MLGLSLKRCLVPSLAALVGFVLAAPLIVSVAAAQDAPVVGGHYAARASDTGFAGAVNSNGGYGASVPLDLPPVRGGLPLPLQVTYGGNRFGAAGVGWDVPLSFIRREAQIAHRRPANTPDVTPDPRVQLSLMLAGSRTDLVLDTATSTFLARRDGAQLQVRDVGGGVLEMYDGNNLRYSFSSDGGGVGTLDNGDLYLLRDIFGPGGANVHLDYNIGAPALPGGITGLSINLASVRYNPDTATGACAKHQINLIYDDVVSAPLSMSVLSSAVLTRVNKLQAIDVTALTNTDAQPCTGVTKSLRKYNFAYQADADTGQFRLSQVTMIGQEDTPERNVTLPVAAYSYGRFTDADDGKIKYALQQSIPLPSDFTSANDVRGISGTITTPDSPIHPHFQSSQTTTQNGLFDFNGDGRPDLTYGSGPGHFHLNIAGPQGTTTFVPELVVKNDVPSSDTAFGRSFTFENTVHQFNTMSTNWVTQRLIDMNGDGRLDLVDSDEEDNVWVVYLNIPHPAEPNLPSWERRTISILPIVQNLWDAGFRFPGDPDVQVTDPSQVHRVPLGGSITGNTVHYHHCWRWTGTDWVLDIDGYGDSDGRCPLPQGQDDNPLQHTFHGVAEDGLTSFVQWELKDINGDGYPDLIYNGSPVDIHFVAAPKPLQNGASPGQFVENDELVFLDFTGSHAVKALINVAGVHLDQGTSAFSAPIMLDADETGGCGVEQWIPWLALGLGNTNQICGFEDVNGDGLVDRIRSDVSSIDLLTTAQLGTGKISDPFSGPVISLPGPIARSQRRKPVLSVCPFESDPTPGMFYYPIQRIAGLRDINGDGIPDYVSGTNARQGDPASGTSWTVAFGTGTGFGPPVAVVDTGVPTFELSVELVDCFGRAGVGSWAATTSGLYDIDGDGQPEVVVYNGQTSSLDIYQHVTRADRSAGRLIKIDNGYGASTNIQYRSAKEDTSTRHHLLPYPEVVVSSVDTTDASGNPLAQPSLYAYGGAAVQVFDPAYDRFVFPGYQRRVTMQYTGDPLAPVTDGMASITDSYPLAPFDPAMDATARYLRYTKAGRASDVTTLSGDMGTDVWTLLGTDVIRDARRIAATHSDYSARLLPVVATGNEYCVDMVFPYDYGQSLAYKNDTTHQSFDQCAEHGFTLQTSVTSYRGTPGTALGTADTIQSPQIVQTSAAVTAFDEFGRVTDSVNNGDLADANDDLCVHVDYAAPTPNTTTRVLNAPAMRTVRGSCGSSVILAKDSFEYDGLTDDPTVVQVSDGFVTAHIVTRYDMDTHLSLGDIRLFNASYFPAGNLKSILRVRDEDGANKTNFFGYDAFGLVPKSMITNGQDNVFVTMTTSITTDPVTLDVTSTTDPNGTVRGNSYDGFGRVVLSKVTPKGGAEGVLSSLTYNGFEFGSTVPRSIVQKVFPDAVPVGTEGTALGRTGTTTLDSLGRATKTEAQLGADYQNKTVVIGQRTYDLLGRVRFQADPFLSTDSFDSAYGTTQFFNTDGTLQCATRGSGAQQSSGGIADDTNEVFSTCFGRSFTNNQEIITRSDPDSVPEATPQSSVSRETVVNAIGRVLERRTKSAREGNPIFEDVTFGYDALGHLTSMKRYRDPANQANPVTTNWHFDSLGWMTKLEEPGVAPQIRTFDSFGEITQVQWCNDLSVAPCPTQDRRSITQFDALGRVTHREDQTNGTVNPETVNNYSYDVGVNNPTPPVTATNVKGRLANATSPTSTVSFSYDPFGRVNARVFTDTAVNKKYVEKHDIHGDGSEQTLHLLLADNAFKDEKVDYAYDTAGRVNSVKYNDGANRDLFTASGTNPIYDVFGRITTAQYGLATFNATYAASGRRLLNDVKVTSGDMAHAHSREIAFPVLNGVTPYDPLGRERQRRELQDGAGTVALLRGYDEIGRLSASQNLQIATNTIQPDRSFSFDALGNVLTQTDSNTGNPGSVSLTYQAPDLDRISSVAYGAAPPSNLTYDGAGNILTEPARSGTRTLTYFPNGQVKTIASGSTNATYKYDAFGAVQQLTLNTPSADMRQDKHFGGLVKQRTEGAASVVTRQIPAPGLVATRHGPTGGWTFAFGEPRGTRFATDQSGAFVQDIDYQPYGEVKNPAGAPPRTTNYTSEQWNGGDLLAALGVVQLGARIYDPVIGRFLSRDPLLIPRTGATTNPYAFAMNDPVNGSDPTGLDDKDTTDWSATHQQGDGSWIMKSEAIEVTGSKPSSGVAPTQLPLGGRISTDVGGNSRFSSTAGAVAKAADAIAGVARTIASVYSGPSAATLAEWRHDDLWRQRYFPTVSDSFPHGVAASVEEYGFWNTWAMLTASADEGGGGDLIVGATAAIVGHYVGDPILDQMEANSAGGGVPPSRGGLVALPNDFDQNAPTWPGLQPRGDGVHLTGEDNIARHYIGQVRAIVQATDPAQRAAVLERLFTQDLPAAIGEGVGPKYSRVPNQRGLWQASPTFEAAQAGGVHAMGVDSAGVLHDGVAHPSVLGQRGIGALRPVR